MSVVIRGGNTDVAATSHKRRNHPLAFAAMNEAERKAFSETAHDGSEVSLTPMLISAVLLALSIFAFDFFFHP